MSKKLVVLFDDERSFKEWFNDDTAVVRCRKLRKDEEEFEIEYAKWLNSRDRIYR